MQRAKKQEESHIIRNGGLYDNLHFRIIPIITPLIMSIHVFIHIHHSSIYRGWMSRNRGVKNTWSLDIWWSSWIVNTRPSSAQLYLWIYWRGHGQLWRVLTGWQAVHWRLRGTLLSLGELTHVRGQNCHSSAVSLWQFWQRLRIQIVGHSWHLGINGHVLHLFCWPFIICFFSPFVLL